jgi:hypothetical protein
VDCGLLGCDAVSCKSLQTRKNISSIFKVAVVKFARNCSFLKILRVLLPSLIQSSGAVS